MSATRLVKSMPVSVAIILCDQEEESYLDGQVLVGQHGVFLADLDWVRHYYLVGGLVRSSESFACCSGANLFLMRTSKVTCWRLISRSAASTFSNCVRTCCSSTRGCLISATSFSISSCSFD